MRDQLRVPVQLTEKLQPSTAVMGDADSLEICKGAEGGAPLRHRKGRRECREGVSAMPSYRIMHGSVVR